MTSRNTTSFRFSPEALDLIDAWALHKDTTRVRFLEQLLARAAAPSDPGPGPAAIRRAQTAFLNSRNPDRAEKAAPDAKNPW